MKPIRRSPPDLSRINASPTPTPTPKPNLAEATRLVSVQRVEDRLEVVLVVQGLLCDARGDELPVVHLWRGRGLGLGPG